MYGLKQAACIDFDRLGKVVKTYVCYPLRSNPGIWCHKTLPKKFALFVDDFGIKYTNPFHAHHLVNTLERYHKISIDWDGNVFYGITLDCNHDRKYADVSMLDYISISIHKFQHPKPKQNHHAPHDWTVPAYGFKVQYTHT